MRCNLCSKVKTKRLERNLSHLGYVKPGGRLTSVAICTELTPAVRQIFRGCGGIFPPHNGEMNGVPLVASPLESPFLGTPKSTSDNSYTGFSQASPSTSTTPIVALTPVPSNVVNSVKVGCNVHRPMKQSLIEQGFAEADRREADLLWAKYFYEANVPFANARHPAFKAAVLKTSSLKGSYVPPSYHDLRTNLLEQVREEVAGKLDDRLIGSVRRFGGTLTFDGWSSVSSRPLINAMLVTPAGELFLGAVDTTGIPKTAEYMASIMLKFIKQVGPENVVQVCTDNASVMLNAMELVQNEYPHIFIQGCATHAMDLLMEDLGKATWVKEVLEQAKTLVKFIRKRQMPLAVYRKHQSKFSLLLPGKTRFACNFIMIDRLLEARESLEQTVVDPDFIAYANKRSLSVKDKHLLSKSVRRVVFNEKFWARCQNFRDMVYPIVCALREFDSKEPSTGKGILIARNLERHLLALSSPPFGLPDDLARTIKENFDARNKMMTTDLMRAAALLNPYLRKDREIMDDSELWAATQRVLRLLTPDEATLDDTRTEFLEYIDWNGVFADVKMPDQSNLAPHNWWQMEGCVGKLIAPIAKRILAQTCSSSACERNWSSYSFVHDKKRNRLLPERAEALVYVYTNSKLLARGKWTDEKRWYEVNLDVEDYDVRDADEVETSHQSTTDPLPDFHPVDQVDDLENSPTNSLQDGWDAPNHVFDFVDEDEVGDKEDDHESVAKLSPSQKTNGDVKCNDVLASGLTLIMEETVVQPEKYTMLDTNNGTMISDPVLENVALAMKDKQPLSDNASRSLFQFSPIEVPKVMEKSSHALLSFSKEMRARTQRTKEDGKSSDSDNVPLAKWQERLKGDGGARLQAKEAPHVLGKRKTPMLPFYHDKVKNPLDTIEQHGKFKSVHPSRSKVLKRKIKQEYDPTESSGAEVPGDSDWALPTDNDE